MKKCGFIRTLVKLLNNVEFSMSPVEYASINHSPMSAKNTIYKDFRSTSFHSNNAELSSFDPFRPQNLF